MCTADCNRLVVIWHLGRAIRILPTITTDDDKINV